MNQYVVVPGPKAMNLTGQIFPVDGFTDISRVAAEAMGIGGGRWRFREVPRPGGDDTRRPAVNRESGVRITDGTVEYWGSEHVARATIAQLLVQFPEELPEGIIEESAHFPIRGFQQDIGRGGVPTVHTWKRMLRWLFMCKYTHLGIYFEDLFPWEGHPEIGVHRGRMSRDELREVIGYGAELGIEVFPSVNLAGHMENILAVPPYWKYSDWHRLREGVLDISNPKARQFAYDLLQEVVDFFPSDYIHIGGDEPWGLGRGKGLDHDGVYRGPELYRDHHARLIQMVREASKTPLLWGDMISGSIMMGEMVSNEAKSRWATILDDPIWQEAVIANWKYNPSDGDQWFEREIDIFQSRGMEQLACTGLRNSQVFYPRFDWALHNNREFLEAARRKKPPGFLVTSWGGTGSECLFSFLDSLILACSEFGVSRDSDWKAKWCALTGESDDLAEIRIVLGSDVNNMILRDCLFRRSASASLSESERGEVVAGFKSAMERFNGLALPHDLNFMKKLVQAGIQIFEGSIRSTTILELASDFAELWRAERKSEGLDVTIARMWGAAGCYEHGLTQDSQGWFSVI